MRQTTSLTVLMSMGVAGCVTVSSVTLDDVRMTESGEQVIIEADIRKPRVLNWSAVTVTADVNFRHAETVDPIAPVNDLALTAGSSAASNRRSYRGTVRVVECATLASAVVTASVRITESGEQPPDKVLTGSRLLAKNVTSTSGSHLNADRLLHVQITDRTQLTQNAMATGSNYALDVRLACLQSTPTNVNILVGRANCGEPPLPGPTPSMVTATANPPAVVIPAGADRAAFQITNLQLAARRRITAGTLVVCGQATNVPNAPLLSNARKYCVSTQFPLSDREQDHCFGVADVGSN